MPEEQIYVIGAGATLPSGYQIPDAETLDALMALALHQNINRFFDVPNTGTGRIVSVVRDKYPFLRSYTLTVQWERNDLYVTPKPCPFCGLLPIGVRSHPVFKIDSGLQAGNRHYVRCSCGAQGPLADSYFSAISAWNGRTFDYQTIWYTMTINPGTWTLLPSHTFPEDKLDVLLCLSSGNVIAGYHVKVQGNQAEWYAFDGTPLDSDLVIAWQYKPEPVQQSANEV